MNKLKRQCVEAFAYALLFTLIYVGVFHYYIPSADTSKTTLHVNQLGLYAELENAKQVQETMQNVDIHTYIYQADGLYVIVSGVFEDKQQSDANGEVLSSLDYSYVQKSFEIKDEIILESIENEDYQSALDRIGEQSESDESK